MVKGVGIAAASIAVGLLLTACGAKPTREAFTAYVVNEGPGTVTPFSTLTGKVSKAIKEGSFPRAIAITPDGTTAYVANADSGTVTPVRTATGTLEKPIKVGSRPIAIALAPG